MCSSYAYFAGSGNVAGPMGTAFATIVPYRTFPAKDREFALAVGSEKLWVAFCRAIGRPELASHAEYSSNALRVKHRSVLEPLLIDIFRQADGREWIERLSAEGIPCSLVNNVQEVFESPQAQARNMFLRVSQGKGAFPVTGPPIKFSATPGQAGAGAPKLGEHTRAVLAELLGLDSNAIEQLAGQGVIV
jgi:crotonobetainyl-CoA:carnitine CoA-transferase CaiB-like acyl-CoA transferase